MSERKQDDFSQISDIIRSIEEYPDEKLAENLAMIHTRVTNVINFGRIDENDNGKQNPAYYDIKMIKNMHGSTSEAYSNYYMSNDYKAKANIIGDLHVMDQKLKKLEKGNDNDDE